MRIVDFGSRFNTLISTSNYEDLPTLCTTRCRSSTAYKDGSYLWTRITD